MRQPGKSKGSRPGSATRPPTSTVRLPLALIDRIDAWAGENDARTRVDAVCRLVELSLEPARGKAAGGQQRARAARLAANQIDRMGDDTASQAERTTRKRRLTEGPTTFRGVRRDQAKRR